MIKKLLAAMLALFAAVAFAATDVNTASQSELEAVKGIGPAISGKILAERQKGQFKDWNDLITRVKGIGDKNSTEFSAAGLTVNGAAMSGAPANPAAVRKTERTTTKTTSTAAATTPATTPMAPATKATPAVLPAPTTAPTAAPATKTATTTTATTTTAPMSAADKKAAAKQAREDRKAAKAEERAAKKAAKAASAT